MPANWETDIDTDDNARHLREAVLALGHQAELRRPAEGLAITTVRVRPAGAPPGGVGELTLTYYPLSSDEFPDSHFLQYLAVLRQGLDAAAMERLAAVLPELNNRLVVGHFGLSRGAGQLHLRHVQRLPAGEKVSADMLGDVLTLFAFTPALFAALLDEVSAGRIEPATARRQLESPGPA
jgi:hypothetical protein